MQIDLKHDDTREDFLLSICIPSYNRAGYLEKTLNSMVCQVGFVECCEIIITDNCSNDNTDEVVGNYVKRYSNIRYFKNEKNLGPDGNFLKAMALARGKYIKLHGDKVCFYETGLTLLIEQLKAIDICAIFLLNGVIKLNFKNPIVFESFDEFVKNISFHSTWMNGIILRRSDYKNIVNPARLAGNYLIQTDMLFRVISAQSRVYILNDAVMFEQPISSKGGYNLFKVFVNNYLSLYAEYLQNGQLSQTTYENERRKLLRHFVFPWYTYTVFMRRQAFETKEAAGIIFTQYKTTPLLYAYPLYILAKVWKKIIRSI